ncbi:MAG: mechanosensitive ion channel family protein [Acidobacteria bacterium]|nr:mechanosensitive ion channel family protein [Acidobacteriota bacterium]
MDFFTGKLYYGNTVKQWLIAAGIIVCTVLLAKLLYWAFGNVIKKLTAKTKTRIDDILVDMLEEPVVFSVIIIGVWYGLATLEMSKAVHRWIATGYYFLIIFAIAWSITRVLDALVEEYLAPLVAKTEGDLDDQLLPIIRKGAKFTVWGVAVIIALNNAGYDVGALLAGLGIGGLAFALAAQDSVANLFGGFTIFVDKPFTIQDRVVVDGYDGTVEEIGIRSTRLRTLAGRLVTIPNSKISNNVVENISSEPARKVALDLGLTYDMDEGKISRALLLLEKIARETAGVDSEKITTAFTGFGDFSLNVKLIYWIEKSADIFSVQTKLNLKVLAAFAKEGLEMAFPTQEIHTKNI